MQLRRSRRRNWTPILLPATFLLLSACSGDTGANCTEARDLTITGQPVPQSLVQEARMILGSRAQDNQIAEAAAAIRVRFPQASGDETTDLLAAAYCQEMAAGEGVGEQDLAMRQSAFIARVNAVMSPSNR